MEVELLSGPNFLSTLCVLSAPNSGPFTLSLGRNQRSNSFPIYESVTMGRTNPSLVPTKLLVQKVMPNTVPRSSFPGFQDRPFVQLPNTSRGPVHSASDDRPICDEGLSLLKTFLAALKMEGRGKRSKTRCRDCKQKCPGVVITPRPTGLHEDWHCYLDLSPVPAPFLASSFL